MRIQFNIREYSFLVGAKAVQEINVRSMNLLGASRKDFACKPGNKMKEIKLVFVGDTFDVLRTEKYLLSAAARPDKQAF